MVVAREFKSQLSQGATRKVFKSGAIKRRINARPLVGLLMLMGVIFTLNHYWPKMRSMFDRPVGNVVVKGRFHYVARARIEQLVLEAIADQKADLKGDSTLPEKSFFSLDLQQLQDRLKREAWVDRVQVSRSWPDQLKIKIVEQKPIARWGEIGFLNYRGELIVAGNRSELMLLPLLSGVVGGEQGVMEQYQFMAPLLRSRDLSIKHLQRSHRGAWVLRLGFENVQEDGAFTRTFDVSLGRDQIVEKVQRLLLVYDQQLQQQRQRIDKIDLRYNNGIAVSWRIESNNIDKQLNTDSRAKGLSG